jgi:hypothetical protein
LLTCVPILASASGVDLSARELEGIIASTEELSSPAGDLQAAILVIHPGEPRETTVQVAFPYSEMERLRYESRLAGALRPGDRYPHTFPTRLKGQFENIEPDEGGPSVTWFIAQEVSAGSDIEGRGWWDCKGDFVGHLHSALKGAVLNPELENPDAAKQAFLVLRDMDVIKDFLDRAAYPCR